MGDSGARDSPEVSVVIPTYNRLGFLREAVGSVLNQTGVDFELVIVDDGSTDGTDAYLGLLAECKTGGRRPVTVIRISHTGMPGAARNRGAEAASGRLLAFLDSDDIWLSGKLTRQVALHQASDGPALSHTREVWLRDGREISQKSQKHRREGDVFADALVKCTIGPSTVLMDRTAFLQSGGFREDLDFAEDYELWLRLVWNRPVAYLDDGLTVKRGGHADQLSERFGEVERIRIDALRDLIDDRVFASPAAHALACGELARKCRIYAKGAEKHGRPSVAVEYTRLAALYDPG